VARLASSLGWALIYAEAEKGARSKNPDLIDLTMRGWSLFYGAVHLPPKEFRDQLHESRTLFDRALQIDPNAADALAGSAQTYFLDNFFGWGEPGTDYEAKALGQADRAIALDPNNVRAYFVKAQYLGVSRRRPNEALGAADAGLAVNSNYAQLYFARAGAENSLGRYEEAKSDVEQAMRLSPRDPLVGTFHYIVGDAEFNIGHFDAATAEYRKALDSGEPGFFVHTNLAAAYALAGKMDEAKAELAEARRLNPAITIKWMKDHTPNLPAVFDGLRKAGLPEE
jgi:adenylate cyclase